MGKVLFWMYLVAILMGLVACESSTNANAPTEPASGVATADSANQTKLVAPEQRVLDFLVWYQNNMDALSKIETVKQVEGKPYEINEAGTEAYLAKLKESGFFFEDDYFESERAAFADLAKEFKDNPQTDGPPTGFDYDRVLLAQDWNDLDKAKIVGKEVNATDAKVTVDIGGPLVFKLRSTKQSPWGISSIAHLD